MNNEKATVKGQAQYGSYLRVVRELRNALKSNMDDYDFVYSKHGEIRYLFDANIVRFFLNPVREYRQASFGLNLDKNVLTSLAIVTAEFLFSRKLCGQWGAPALISPAHAKEIEQHANSIIGKLGRELDKYDNQDNLRHKINEAILKASRPDDVESSIDVLFKSDHDIKRFIPEETYEAQMFMRLSREDLLEPLFTDILMTKDVVNPDSDEVNRWAGRIAKHRKSISQRAASKKEVKITAKDRADGETLTQLALLNKAAREQEHAVRYVLITFDRAVYSAANEWIKTSRPGVERFNPVRRIGQYMPMLNLVEMPNHMEHVSLTENIGSAIDTLLTGLPDSLGADDGQTGKATDSKLRGEGSDGRNPSESAEKIWTKLAEQSIYLNASLLSRRIEAFSDLADFLNTSSGVREAVVKYMQQTVQSVERVHARFNIENQLITAVESRKPKGKMPTRGLLMLRPKFGKFTGGKSLYKFLNDVIFSEDNGELENLYSALSDSKQHQTLLFAGCVAFWAGAWKSADFFAERARDELNRARKSNVDKFLEEVEITYFQVAAKRYVAMDLNGNGHERVEALKGVLDFIKIAFSKANSQGHDGLSLLRLDLEGSLISLAIAYILSIIDEEPLAGSTNQYLEQATEGFLSCHERMNQISNEIDDNLLEKQIEAELYIGLSGCIIHHFFFLAEMPENLKSKVSEIMEKVRCLASDEAQIVPSLYRIAPDFLDLVLEPSQSKLRILSKKLSQQLSATTSMEIPSTQLDQFIMNELMNRLGSTLEP